MSQTYISPELRKRVAEQARHRCGYCLTREDIVGTPMEMDHIIPESLGGRTEEDNLWLACSLCNDYKGNRIAALDPITGELVRLFDPRHQSWQDHFVWSTVGDHIVGVTPIGRGTIIALNLNRPSLVRARQLWIPTGWHPPKD
jgi:5-methylcytosine-specific restriction endonuclease McrA